MRLTFSNILRVLVTTTILVVVNGQAHSQDSLVNKIKKVSQDSVDSILSNVTVVSSTPKTSLDMTPSKVTLNVSNNAIYSVANAYDIVKQLPGVTELNNSILFKMRTTSVQIDGKTYKLADEDLKSLLTSIQGNSIDKVEINMSPSVKYDAQGGSVINIVTKKKKNAGLTGSLIFGSGWGESSMLSSNKQATQFFCSLPSLLIFFKKNPIAAFKTFSIPVQRSLHLSPF